mgnify:CR=1 FL=1
MVLWCSHFHWNSSSLKPHEISIKKLIFQSHRWGRGWHDFFNGHFEALLRPLWVLFMDLLTAMSNIYTKWWWIEFAAFNFWDWIFFPLNSSLSCLIIIGNKIWNDDNKFSVTSKPSTTLKTANFGKMCSWGNKQNQEIHKTLSCLPRPHYQCDKVLSWCEHF